MNVNRRIALLAISSAVLLPVVDAMAKWLVRDYPVVMVAWARMGLVAVMMAAWAVPTRGWVILRPQAPRLQVLRGLASVLGTSMFFLGVRHLPLAECTAVIFLAPILANLFAHIVLKEPADRLSWLLALASFGGVVLIAHPGGALFKPAILFPLAGSVGLAAFMMLSRAVGHHDAAQTTAFFGPLVAFGVFSLALPWHWMPLQRGPDALLLVGIGVLSTCAGLLQAHAYRLGGTHRVAPFGYLSLVFAIVLGWALFGDVPAPAALAGMAAICAAGLVMVLRRS